MITLDNNKIPKVGSTILTSEWSENQIKTMEDLEKTTLADDLNFLDIDWELIEERAQDRSNCRIFVSTVLKDQVHFPV